MVRKNEFFYRFLDRKLVSSLQAHIHSLNVPQADVWLFFFKDQTLHTRTTLH